MIDVKNNYGIKRIKSKTAKDAIIQKLANDFNLTPIIAEAFYQQFDQYYREHSNIKLAGGEIAYQAVSADEPAGKHLRLTKKVTVSLKLIDFNSDFEVLANYGLAGLRRHRIARLTKQTCDQEALLSYEDLSMILTASPATIKRDIYYLRKQGMFIMTRGAKKDMGPGLSHKTIIIDLYFKNYTFSDIEQKTNHSETSVKRYLADFTQIAALCQQNFSRNQIRMITQKSDRLIREYIQLYQTYSSQNSQRLLDMITPQNPGKEAEKKSALEQSQGGESHV